MEDGINAVEEQVSVTHICYTHIILNTIFYYPLLFNCALATFQKRLLVDSDTKILGTERLFGTAGDIITDHCCHLLPENVETLIFLKFNSHILDMLHLDLS